MLPFSTMADEPKPLSDNDVHERLTAARYALGSDNAATTRGKTALAAANRALMLLSFALVKAMEEDDDQISGVLPDTRD